MQFFSKPEIKRDFFLRDKEIDANLIRNLTAALNELDIPRVKSCLSELAKTNAKISDIPAALGISRSGFYLMLSEKGKLDLQIVLKMLILFGLKIKIEK
jgi:DNA-binding phage protein